MRYTLQLLKKPKHEGEQFGQSLLDLVKGISFCTRCHNISDDELCNICLHPKRDKSTICVVEDLRDLLAIERTEQFYGTYHVLGGTISPLDGIGPADLHIESLLTRCESNEVTEVIFALPATMEGDTTNFYLYRKLKDRDIKLTTLSRGVAVGDELQYTDEITLGRSLVNRLPYENSFAK